jgi:hypothetical protein
MSSAAQKASRSEAPTSETTRGSGETQDQASLPDGDTASELDGNVQRQNFVDRLSHDIHTSGEAKQAITGGDTAGFRPESVVEKPAISATTDEQELLKEWQGVVEWIGETYIRARLTDLNDPTAPEELVEIETVNIAPDDRALVERGAVFYWDIGRRKDRYGSLQNFSEIRFRRLPAWTERDLTEARARASNLREELFGGDEDESGAR